MAGDYVLAFDSAEDFTVKICGPSVPFERSNVDFLASLNLNKTSRRISQSIYVFGKPVELVLIEKLSVGQSSASRTLPMSSFRQIERLEMPAHSGTYASPKLMHT